MTDLLVRNGTVFDGSGSQSFVGDVAVQGGRVELVGDASRLGAARVIDAAGKAVSPGFIDVHSHADFPIYVDGLAQSGIRQGLTTLVIGNCGHGPAPAPDRELTKVVTIGYDEDWGIDLDWTTFEEYLGALFERGQSMNVAPLVAHGPVRLAAMGFDARAPSAAELDTMRSLVDEAMSAGAIGFATGLEYSPGQNAVEPELIALAEVSARHGGCYASHIRNRGDHFEKAVDEALNIGRGAGLPVQFSHLAPRPYAPEGAFDRVLDKIAEARTDGMRVGIDTFPDPWGPAHLTDLLPPWVHEGPKDEVAARLRDPKTADLCRDYVEHPTNFLLRLGSFDNFYLTHSRAHPELVERTLEEASQSLGLDHTETILKLAGDDGEDFAGVIIRHIFATQEDLDKLLMDPHCSVGSDGAVASMDGTLSGLVMNRSSYGYAPRFIREYALDRGLMSVEEAVRKMTSLPAGSVGIRDRGRLAPGMAADLVVMDLDELRDNTTDAEPQAYPSGIEMVIVNGEVVFDGDHTGLRPGALTERERKSQ